MNRGRGVAQVGLQGVSVQPEAALAVPVRFACGHDLVAVQAHGARAVAALTDPEPDHDGGAPHGQRHLDAVQPGHEHRVENQCVGAPHDAEQALHHDPERDARSRGVHAPAAFDLDLAPTHLLPALRGDVAVGHDGVAGAEVRRRLAAPGVAGGVARVDRVDEVERGQQVGTAPQTRQRLGVPEVRVRVHRADLASEEARALGTLELHHRAAAVGGRPIEQVGAVGHDEVLGDEVGVRARGLGREHLVVDRVDHRQDRVGQPGGGVARVQQVRQLPGVVLEAVPRDDAVGDEVLGELVGDGGGRGSQLGGELGLDPRGVQTRGERLQGLVVQRDGPAARHARNHGRVGGLE
jgi:hypothetical protein